MFSPAATFENGSSSLKRSNTLPDGYLDRAKRQGKLGEAGGKRDSKDWSRFINRISLRQIDRRGELSDSPVVREGSEATLVSSSLASDLAARMAHEERSGDVGRTATMMGTGKNAPDYETMEQWTPNMQEILAKLRTFESGSPIGR